MSNCNNFIKRVIGVTRTFNWTITTNGAAVPLVAEDLTLQLVPPRGEAVSLPFDVDDNIVSFTWQGEDQHIIGCYSLILWANYGEDNQRRVDIHNFVELIPWSDRQSGEYSDLVEETIELETADFGENIIIVDNLNSTSATDALSANMGRQLNVTKQDVIQDLATIRSGAAAGAAVKEWAKNDPLITDDATQASASRLNFNGNLFEQWVPGIAASIGLKGIAGFLKLADISQWDSAYNDRMLPTVAAVKAKLQAVLTALGTIEAVIPSQASSTNKLTDKDYVDGAIATNTANFVGTFDTLAELQAVPNPTKNDYGFVIESDAQGNEYYDRYKYTGTQWLFEYKVESTPFTAEQWAAIQSGITAALVTKLSALPTNAELNTALAAKQPVINDLTTIRSGAAAGATAYQKPSGGIPASDMAAAVQTSLGKADAAAPQATTYTKTEVDAALALKQTSSQIATINGSDITHGGNVTIVAAEGQTITIDAAPTAGSNNAVSSGGVYNATHVDSSYVEIDIDEYTPVAGVIGSNGKWAYTYLGNTMYGVFIPVTPGYRYKIVGRDSGTACAFAFMTDNSVGTLGTEVTTFATGYSGRINVPNGGYIEAISPQDAQYLWVSYTVGSVAGDWKPSAIDVADIIEIKSIVEKLVSFATNQTKTFRLTDGSLAISTGMYPTSTTYVQGNFSHTPRYIRMPSSGITIKDIGDIYGYIIFYDAEQQYIKYSVIDNTHRTFYKDEAEYFRITLAPSFGGGSYAEVLAADKLTIEGDWLSVEAPVCVFEPISPDSGYQNLCFGVNINTNQSLYGAGLSILPLSTRSLNFGVLHLPPSYTPEGDATPLIIYLHGAAERYTISSKRFGDKSRYFPEWSAAGYAQMDVDMIPSLYNYSGTGTCGTGDDFACVIAAYKWVVEHYNIRRDGVYLFGRSRGAQAVLTILANYNPKELPVICALSNAGANDILLYGLFYSMPAAWWDAYCLSMGLPSQDRPTYTGSKVILTDSNIASYLRTNIDIWWGKTRTALALLVKNDSEYQTPLQIFELLVDACNNVSGKRAEFANFLSSCRFSSPVPLRFDWCVGDTIQKFDDFPSTWPNGFGVSVKDGFINNKINGNSVYREWPSCAGGEPHYHEIYNLYNGDYTLPNKVTITNPSLAGVEWLLWAQSHDQRRIAGCYK